VSDGGCTNCKAKPGCDDRKGPMLAQIDDVLAQLYPTRTWGESRDEVVHPMPPDELSALAEELAIELKAATFIRLGDDTEPCDYIYVMCMGRAPCIVQVRDHGVPVPAEWQSADRIDELYLRVVIGQRAVTAGEPGSLARLGAVQQVAMSATREADGTFTIRESPRAGVYDAPLLHRMQKLVAVLPAYEVSHIDFGEIAHAPPGFHAGSWGELFGGAPSIANYLFYPQPTTMVTTMQVGP
jgi:hypothetical protein